MEIDDGTLEDDKSTIELLDETMDEPEHHMDTTSKTNEIKVISSEMLMPHTQAQKVPKTGRKTKKCVEDKSKNGEPIAQEKKLKSKNLMIKPDNCVPRLSFYGRQKLIPLLKDHYPFGTPEYKIPLTDKLNLAESEAGSVVEYIEDQAKQYERKCENDNDSEPFVRINDWINFLHDKNMNEISGNEFPLLFKLIANLEAHPAAEDVGDIDLKELYTFISNIMIGYPTKTPTGKTGQFLHETFKSIIDEMNSPGHHTCDLDEQLKNSTLIAGPNAADNFNLEELRLILCNSSTNPFNFPFEFLNLNHFHNNKFDHPESNGK